MRKYFKFSAKKHMLSLSMNSKVFLFIAVIIAMCACSKEDDYDDYGGDNNWSTNDEYSLATPTGVSVRVDGSSVYLTWNAVTGATIYNIYHSTSATGYYNFRGWAQNTSKVFTQESSGSHYYKIRAVNEETHAYSDYSGYVSVYIDNTGGGNTGGGNTSGGNTSGGTSQQKPSVPTGVTVSNEGSVAYPIVAVRWNSVSNATKYYVYKSSSASSGYSKIGEATYNVYSDPNPPLNGASAYYKIKAVNSAGESGYSDYAYYKSQTNSEAYAPAPVQYGNCTVSGTTMTLRWTVPTGAGIGTPTSAMLRVRNPISGVYATLETLSGTATSVSFTYTPWIDKDGYVYAGIITENAKGTSGGVPKIYDTKNKKWIN